MTKNTAALCVTVILLSCLLLPPAVHADLPPVPEVGKVCPIDIPNCCDPNWPDDAGQCCRIPTKENFYANDTVNCVQNETNCRYSDTGEMDRDCCSSVALTPQDACCAAFPDLKGCNPEDQCIYPDTGELDLGCCRDMAVTPGDECCTAFPNDLQGCTPQQGNCNANTVDRVCCSHASNTPGDACCNAYPDLGSCQQQPPPPQPEASRSKLTTNEGQQAYDSDYAALQDGTVSPDGTMPGQSIYNTVQSQYTECQNQCTNQYNGESGTVANPDCDSFSSSMYDQCMQACSVSGSSISCPGVLPGCVQVIQNCYPVQYNPASDINNCIAQYCAQYEQTMQDVSNANNYAPDDYQTDQENAKNPPQPLVEGSPGPVNDQYQAAKQDATQAEPDQYTDSNGNAITPDAYMNGLYPDVPYVNMSVPLQNVTEGQSIDMTMVDGFYPEEIILTAGKDIGDGAVTIEGSIPAPLWTTPPKSLFIDNIPAPDGQVLQYTKITTTDGNGLEDDNPYKGAVMMWSVPEEKAEAFLPKAMVYDSEAGQWNDLATELDYCKFGVCFYFTDPEGAGVYAFVLASGSGLSNQSNNGNNTPGVQKNTTCCAGPAALVLVLALFVCWRDGKKPGKKVMDYGFREMR
jgi:hypothetical protein